MTIDIDATNHLLRQFCQDLGLMWRQAGGPSLRTLSVQVPLSKSQLGAILKGDVRRPPEWTIVRSLITVIHQHAQRDGRLQESLLRAGIEEYWRPRYTAIEHSYRNRPLGGRLALAGRSVVPQQLPPSIYGFVGRTAEVKALTSQLTRTDRGAGQVAISSIAGPAGIGKTALALHWAHRVAHRFPDGHLFANLRETEAAEAVRTFLDALQVPPYRTSSSLTAQIGLYRSLVAGRRLLIVLDDVRDSDHVRPLLPASDGCAVVITSRVPLTGLVTMEGAHPVMLNALPDSDARELIIRRVGTVVDRVAFETTIERCAGLPQALALAAARIAVHSQTDV
jgi:hypothetical protein